MSDESPKKDAPPTTEAAALAALFENDYFRLKVEEAVRQRTQTELNIWWKRMVATAAVITAVIGAFGIKAYMSLNDAAGKAEEVAKAVSSRSLEVNELVSHAKDDVSSFRKTTEQVQAGLDENRRQVADFMSGAADRAGEFAQRFGTFEEGFRRDRENVDRSLTAAGDRFKDADHMLSQANRALEDARKEQEGMRRDYTAFKEGMNEDYKSFKTSRVSDFDRFTKSEADWRNTVDKNVSSLEQKLLGGGTFVINEKSPTQLNPPLADGVRNPLTVRVKRVSSKELLGLKIQDSTGNVVVQPVDLLVNESVSFRSGEYSYTLTLRYITELFMNSDQAGIDLTWERIHQPAAQAVQAAQAAQASK
jgi:hypothetical protein